MCDSGFLSVNHDLRLAVVVIHSETLDPSQPRYKSIWSMDQLIMTNLPVEYRNIQKNMDHAFLLSLHIQDDRFILCRKCTVRYLKYREL
jgi:hypothetical protein